ncbi:MAG: ABC transporter ATP-binding protein [Desulfobacteraceae bacterium]
MKLLIPYFKKHTLHIIAGVICMIVVDGMQLVIPEIIKQSVDMLAGGSPEASVFAHQAFLIIILGALMTAIRYAWRVLLMGSARHVEKGLREELFNRIIHLDPKFYDTVRTGDIMARATSDINHIRMAFGLGIVAIIDAFLLGGATIAVMMWMNVKLTLLALIPMPFLIVSTRILGRKMHEYHNTAQESFSALTELVRESFFGIRVVKVFNFENLVNDRVAGISTDYFSKNLKRAILTSFFKPLMTFFFNSSTFIIIFYGGFLVTTDALTPGELVAFIQYMGILAWPMIALGWMTNLLQRGLASLKRVRTVIETVPSVRSFPDAAPPVPGSGDIGIADATFAYDPGAPVLDHVSMHIPKGGLAGISGPPGSGKTSLVQLIPRLYDPESGHVSIAGQDVRHTELEALRSRIGFMPQESFIFSGSIRENIVMGREISDRRLDDTIRAAMLADTIQAMPEGLETVVGERGVTLSGGQKQRIALARALAAPTDILLLDDPVSQMDTDTASRVMEGIRRLKGDATLIIVSHRIAALTFCDSIFILNNGRIENSGDHKTLMETNLFYKNSFTAQMYEENDDVVT